MSVFHNVPGVPDEKMERLSRDLVALLFGKHGCSTLLLSSVQDFRAQVPDWVPLKKDDTVVYLGIVEIALGSALALAPKKQRAVIGNVAAIFFTAIFPGNISQYSYRRSAFGLNTDGKRFARLLFQPALVYWAWKSTRKD